MIENYKCKFKARGKFIFVPSVLCDKKAKRLLSFGASLELPHYFFHYRPGIASSSGKQAFFRIDLKNFFYSIGRNRVARLLRRHRFPGNARTYAEWSTVRNPYQDALNRGVLVSVYFDDLIGSSSNMEHLQVTYDGILCSMHPSKFSDQPRKAY
jgi:hypothetical protein